MNSIYVIGADIGGTHITTGLVDLRYRTLIPGSVFREKLNSRAKAGEIIDVWAGAIKKVQASYAVPYIGIAIPGPFDYENGICMIKDQDKYDHLYEMNVRDMLAGRLQIPSDHILLTNDAASFLQGEVFGGAALGTERVIGITLGTGLGSAFYHNSLARNSDRWNLPFNDGIAEDYLSTRWFIRRYKELTGGRIQGVSELLTVHGSDTISTQLFMEFGTNLARFIQVLITENSPDLIVLGGNIAKAFDHFQSSMMRTLQFTSADPVIRLAELGEEAALIGAASHWTKKSSNPV